MPPRRPTVLVVDDDAGVLQVTDMVLRREFTVVCAGSGEQALHELESREFAVVVTDLRMPGMSGLDLLRVARERQPLAGTLMVTAYADLDVTLEAINAGLVDRFLEKPWPSREVFLRAVRQLSSTFRLTKEREVRIHEMLQRERLEAVAMARRLVFHDVRNVVMALQASLANLRELLQDPSADKAELLAELDAAQSASAHLGELVRPEGPSTRVPGEPPMPVEVAEIIDQVRRMLVSRRPPRVRLVVSAPEGCFVLADSLDVIRALQNLADNALTALREQCDGVGTVSITAEASQDHVKIYVADDGPGLPEVVRAADFELGVTTRGDRGGTGLGLYASKELIESNGGTLVRIDAGIGTTFLITLPC